MVLPEGIKLCRKVEDLVANPVDGEVSRTVTLVSPYLGHIRFSVDKLVSLPKGLIGFPGLKNFVILECGEDSPFMWFHSLDEPSIAFMVMDPLLIKPDYRVSIKERDVADIGEPKGSDLVLLAIATIKDGHPKVTVNLRAPIIINIKTMKGKQILLENSGHPVRYPVL